MLPIESLAAIPSNMISLESFPLKLVNSGYFIPIKKKKLINLIKLIVTWIYCRKEYELTSHLTCMFWQRGRNAHRIFVSLLNSPYYESFVARGVPISFPVAKFTALPCQINPVPAPSRTGWTRHKALMSFICSTFSSARSVLR